MGPLHAFACTFALRKLSVAAVNGGLAEYQRPRIAGLSTQRMFVIVTPGKLVT
jgi:hypothetical protein